MGSEMCIRDRSTTTSENASIVKTLFDLFWDTAKFLIVYYFTNPASITAINYWMMLIGGNGVAGGDYGGDSGGGDDSGGGVGCEGFSIMIY